MVNKIEFLELFSNNSINEEHTQISSTYENMTKNIKMKNVYEKEIQNINKEINNLNVLSVLEQEKIIIILNNFMSAHNIELNNISFTEPIFILLENINSSSEEKTVDDNSIDNESQFAIITANIEFKSNYEDMLEFIDAVQKNTDDTAICSINVITIDEVFVQCTMTLNFYALPVVNEHF